MRNRLIVPGYFLAAMLSAGSVVHAQQEDRSEAVEEFAPQLDVGYAMQPRVGLFGITELMMAALQGNLDEVKRLIEQGTDIEETDDTGGTPLMWAVQGGDIEIVNYLIDSGADVGAVGGRNATALMIAVISGKEDIGVRLLEAGATFGGELSHQQDYLEYAAARGQPTLVGALIRYGADLAESGPDALCFAIRNRHIDVVRALIDAGVDVNRRGNLGNDLPIIHALQTQNQAIVRLLVDAGAELDRKDRAGRASIMYYAAQTGQPSVVAYLLENGAVFSEQEANQLLRIAVYQGSMEMVDLFVAGGATISTRHLFDAISNRHYDMADAFVDAIGIESMDDYQLDMLIDHVQNYGHQTMLDALLDVVESREDQGRLRLLFEMVEADKCELKTWHAGAGAVTSTFLDDFSCEAELFTSRRQSTLFVLQGERIDVHSLDNEFATFSLKMPTQEIDARLGELRRQFAERYAGNYDWVAAKVAAIGYLDNGHIAVVTHTDGPADGTYASQFTWDGSAWTLSDIQGCHRFDWICHMPGVDGRSVNRWPVRRTVWHAALQRNPGFVQRVTRTTGDATAGPQSAVMFDFDGQRSELGYTLSGSDHCAEECTFTDSVVINPDGTDPIQITLANSRVSIAGRFILVRPINENSRVYDLGTGADVLGDIGRATWIH
jgi:ankyrin repeat protein